MVRLQIVAVALLIAGVAVSGEQAASAAPAHTAQAKPAPTHPYVVRAGEGGWFQIARAHGVTMQQLLTANHATTATRVTAGQKINVPVAAKTKARVPARHA